MQLAFFDKSLSTLITCLNFRLDQSNLTFGLSKYYFYFFLLKRTAQVRNAFFNQECRILLAVSLYKNRHKMKVSHIFTAKASLSYLQYVCFIKKVALLISTVSLGYIFVEMPVPADASDRCNLP